MQTFWHCRNSECWPVQTTIMAASYKGGVVLGADSRTSTGAYVANRVTNKITQLAEKVCSGPEVPT